MRNLSSHTRPPVVVILILLGFGTLIGSLSAPLQAQWQIKNDQGETVLKFGLLGQGWMQAAELPGGQSWSRNLYLRRLRLISGGTLHRQVTFFFDTDSPCLGKGEAGGKNTADIFIQDFFVTWSTGNRFKLDGGMILVPICYNCTQSAASLMSVDYGAYSFLASGPTTSRVGRDYGLQARGYVFNQNLEYRAGVFQGYRDQDSTTPFRYTARVAYQPFAKQTGVFYSGTHLGAQKALSLGASVDGQGDYRTYAMDLFYDQPVRGGDGITLQFDYLRHDGGTLLKSLPRQNAYLTEFGYYLHKTRLGFFGQLSWRDFLSAATCDENKMQFGVSRYFSGHNLSLKLGYGRLLKDGEAGRNEVVLQLQAFVF